MEGPSRVVGAGTLFATPGLHHGNLTTRPATGEGVRACSDVERDAGLSSDIIAGGDFIFASSTQITGEETYAFGPGLGYRLGDDVEIVARMHYLNTTSAPLSVEPRYVWETIDETTLEHELAPFGFIYGGFEIPANSEKTVTADCELPESMSIVTSLPHMHALGTAFTASFLGGVRNGEAFLRSAGYDPQEGVLEQHDPAIDLGQGNGLSFSCSWTNTHNKTIVEGTGDNEMCMLFGYAYPADQVSFGFANDTGCGVASF